VTIIEAIAERIHAIAFRDLPPAALSAAKTAILDTVGVTLAGAREPCAATVDRIVTAGESRGECLIFGTNRRAPALDAALINGTAAHALDFDDVSDTLGGHPSAPILAALFALAELLDADGASFIAAYVAGFETAARIGRGVNYCHYEKGWHPTATLGVFGAAAASCHLLRLAPAVSARALAIAASLAGGIKANFGTMTKPFHVGHCARDGLMAALLARDGFTANPAALEHKQGFLMVFNGEGNFDAAAILRDWGQPFDIVEPGIGIKQYPCCASTHAPLDAMIALVGEHGLRPDMVERVQSLTHPRRLAHTDRPDPRSGLDAKFSVQYCLARALAHGRIALDHFDGDAFGDPEIRRLMGRIEAVPKPERTATGDSFGGEVRVFLKDGRMLAREVGEPLGRSRANPLPAEALAAKFADCAGRVLPPPAVARLRTLLSRIDEVAGLREITAAMLVPTE
jgi:2-methylcitrate dehydratase PrpD